jgi:hypothetical protein
MYKNFVMSISSESCMGVPLIEKLNSGLPSGRDNFRR